MHQTERKNPLGHKGLTNKDAIISAEKSLILILLKRAGPKLKLGKTWVTVSYLLLKNSADPTTCQMPGMNPYAVRTLPVPGYTAPGQWGRETSQRRQYHGTRTPLLPSSANLWRGLCSIEEDLQQISRNNIRHENTRISLGTSSVLAQSEPPRPIPWNQTSDVYRGSTFNDKVTLTLHNVTLTSHKPCNTITRVIAAKQTVIIYVYIYSIYSAD